MPLYGLFRAFYRDPEELSEILKESKNPEKIIIEIIKFDTMGAPHDYDKWKIVEATLKKIPQNKRDDVIKEDISKRREDYNPKEDKSFAKKEIKKQTRGKSGLKINN